MRTTLQSWRNIFETQADIDDVANQICTNEATPLYANATLVRELQATFHAF